MIGINLHNNESAVIEEFFQLFKTPWECYQAQRTYKVVITDRQNTTIANAALIVILRGNCCTSLEHKAPNNTKNQHFDLLSSGGMLFPVYTGVTTISEGQCLVTKNRGGKCVGSRCIHDGKVIIRLGFNLFEEVKILLEQGQPLINAHIPTLDIHIHNLRKWILDAGIPLVEIPPVPYGSPFYVCLTHDVDFVGIRNHRCDHTLIGFLYRALWVSTIQFFKRRYPLKKLIRNWIAALTLPLVQLGFKKDIWFQFKNYLKFENGAPSTFFFIPFKNDPGKLDRKGTPANSVRTTKYDIDELKDTIHLLQTNGCEIGVHGIDGWLLKTHGEAELKKIRTLVKDHRIGVRMHWLYCNEESLELLDMAGYQYDSTWGYNEKAGFRAGTFQVFKSLQTETLLELPMHIMDTSLFYPDHMNLTFEQGLEKIRQFADNAEIFGGVLTLNWHHRSIAPERLWDDVYADGLSYFRAKKAKFLTAGSVVNWFRKRRSISFGDISYAEKKVKIELCFGEEDVYRSDLIVVRIHVPVSKKNCLKKDASDNHSYVADFVIDGTDRIVTGCLDSEN